jgi:hypothetical protein
MKKWCVIQSGRRVHQLSTVATFTRKWVADTMGTWFILLLICHWWWIWWRRNPPLKRVQQRRLIPIIRKKRICRSKISGPLIHWKNLHLSTEKIYTYPAWTRKQTCKFQITQYSYMWIIVTHTFVRATIVSTSNHARISWLFDVTLFMMITSWNGKMRRNRSIRTTSVHVLVPIISHINNKSYGK